MSNSISPSDRPAYVGESAFVRFAPLAVVPFALLALLYGDVIMFVALALPALAFAVWLPWRFEVHGDGMELWFGLGRIRFFPRDSVRVRAGLGGATMFPAPRARVGYPLTSGLIERDRTELCRIMQLLGFDVVD